MSDGSTQSPMKGCWGTICTVDASTGKIELEELDRDLYDRFLGGVGIGAKILWDRLPPGTDPYSPGNMLGFTTGVLTDTGALFSGRFTVVGKSPASGGWGDANGGGFFSPFLKRCGIDALFVTGASETPVYLYIDDKTAELRDARDLWGKDTIETENILQSRYGKGAQVACIGKAGEGLSRIAGICTDRGRIAARSGLGGVMGSKGLKAVVAYGKRRPPVHDKDAVKQISKQFRERLYHLKLSGSVLNDLTLAVSGWLAGKGLPAQFPFAWRWMLKEFGTPSLTPMCAESGDSPVKNWGGATPADFPWDKYKKIGLGAVLEHETRKYGCYSCPIRCGGHVTLKNASYEIEDMHKPEYETICSFGALLLNDDLGAIFHMNDLVNRGGIDSISCGAVIAFAIECFENGILTEQDTDGLELRWGNAAAIIKLTQKIVDREGIGDVLADGVKPAADRLGKGAHELAVHCGGIEAPMHDPKFDPGQAVSYYCDASPARHSVSCDQYWDMQKLGRRFPRATRDALDAAFGEADRHAGRLAIVNYYKMLTDCAGVCLFGTLVGGELPMVAWLNAATGRGLDPDEYLTVGERVSQLRHAINVREGLNPIRDFRPNGRIYGAEPLQEGPVKNITLDVDAMAESYYRVGTWDRQTGRADRDRLEKLDLPEVITALYK